MYKTKPFAHQARVVERFKDADYFALFWEMGTGKTKTVIDVAAHKFSVGQCARNIIVAPNMVHAQWVNEQLPMHCRLPYTAFVYETNHTQKYAAQLAQFLAASARQMSWLAIHTEAFQYDRIEAVLAAYLQGQPPFWIIDEATRIKNPAAKSVKRLCRLRRQYGGPAAALTGTSLAKSPVDVWQIMEFLKPGLMGCSYTAFTRRHTILTKQEVPTSRGPVKIDIALTPVKFQRIKAACEKVPPEADISIEYAEIARKHALSLADVKLIAQADQPIRYKNLDQLKAQLRPYSSAVKKQDCLDLPEKQYYELILPISAPQKQILRDMRKYAVAEYAGRELTIQHKALLQLRGLQVCGGFFPHQAGDEFTVTPIAGPNAKLDYILQDLDEIGEQSFIVWAVFTAELRLLTEKLAQKAPVALLAGQTKPAERADVVARFLAGEIQGLVANPAVAGFGLNLQRAGIQYWYSRNYRVEARLQAEDRSHRIGAAVSPIYKDLVYDVVFEKEVLAANKLGKNMNDYFNSVNIEELLKI